MSFSFLLCRMKRVNLFLSQVRNVIGFRQQFIPFLYLSAKKVCWEWKVDDSERSQVKDDLSQEWVEVRRPRKKKEQKEEGEGMERRKVKEWSSLCSRMCVLLIPRFQRKEVAKRCLHSWLASHRSKNHVIYIYKWRNERILFLRERGQRNLRTISTNHLGSTVDPCLSC